MNICQTLLESASRSRFLLKERKSEIAEVILCRQNKDGGFIGKGAQSDLYYTGFALLSLLALEVPFNRAQVVSFLNTADTGTDCDLAHLAALIRCRRLMMPSNRQTQNAFRRRLESFRCSDGAYHHLHAANQGSAYGCFLAVGAYQDLDAALPDGSRDKMLECLERLNKGQGGYFNEPDIPAPSVPATAAAIVVQRALTGSVKSSKSVQWLMSCYDEGGFRVMPIAPVSDLLSTAVAVFALSAAGADLKSIRQPCLCFTDMLWKGGVGFCANPFDSSSDTEYMFYGLLTAGILCAGIQ